jgi:hypothetical protein
MYLRAVARSSFTRESHSLNSRNRRMRETKFKRKEHQLLIELNMAAHMRKCANNSEQDGALCCRHSGGCRTGRIDYPLLQYQR